jgi:Gamma-glutamyl cyclotransferase, AIG2-like
MPAPPVSGSTPWLFVYGTLMPGRLRWPLVAADVVRQRPSAVRGTLYDTGRGYPALVVGVEHPHQLGADPDRGQWQQRPDLDDRCQPVAQRPCGQVAQEVAIPP